MEKNLATLNDDFDAAARMMASGEVSDAVIGAIENDAEAQKLQDHGISSDIFRRGADAQVSQLAKIALILGKTLRIEIS